MMRSCYPNAAPPPFLENTPCGPCARLLPILFHHRSKEPAMAMSRLPHKRLLPSRPHEAHEDTREDCREVSSLYSSSSGVLIVEAAIVFAPIVLFFFPRHAILTVTGSDTTLVTKSINARRIRTAFGAGVLRTGSPTIGENITARLHLTEMAFPTRLPTKVNLHSIPHPHRRCRRTISTLQSMARKRSRTNLSFPRRPYSMDRHRT
ncbi:hypothetical protein EDD85DRAFT_237027 [Armillaria nabsnona]|nr:hypothetical protein EDD85DRAFT_237027 [Armillaria nabsnona]